MKHNQVSILLLSVILPCWTAYVEAAGTNAIVTLESVQSRLVPQTGVTYRISANWIYTTDDPGPANVQNSLAWSLANEFVFRTGLRDILVLPASSSGKRKEDHFYAVTFERKSGGKHLILLIDPRNETVQMKEDN